MKLEYSMLAEAAQLQGAMVNILHGGVNQFNGTYPLIVKQIAVVMFFEVEKKDTDIKQIFTFGIETPKSGIKMFEGSATGTFSNTGESSKAIVPINIGLHTVADPGEHWYVVYLNGEEILRKAMDFHMQVHIPENKLDRKSVV